MEKISEIIKETRLSLGLSQERLAAKANVTTRTVLSTEGGHKCSVQTLMAICEALGLEVIVSKKE
jgi:transcriptional regulator with XRE-family HTH domain